MKIFFKKLAYVLALLMLVSMLTPVGTAYAKQSDTFQVTQIAATKFNMIFTAAVDITVEDIDVVLLLNNAEMDVPVKKISIEKNIVTVELFASLLNGFTYKVTCHKETQEFIGSIGTISAASFHYWTKEKGDNLAYVSTEAEPAVITLEYVLYDANGVEITETYDPEKLGVEYAIINDNGEFSLYDNQLVCNKPGIAEISVKVTWIREDGRQEAVIGTNTVVARLRPAISFIQAEAGFINIDAYEYGAQESFMNNARSPFWAKNMYYSSWVFGDEGTLQFAAVVKDSRGNTLTTGINDYGEFYPENEEGSPLYPYGFFRFVSSNDEIMSIDDNGILTFHKPGSAAIFTYFVDITGQKEKEVFAGVTVLKVYPERYVATYAVADPSLTIASETAGAENTASFVLTAFDQYGTAVALENGAADIKVVTTSDSVDVPQKDIIPQQSTAHSYSWGVEDCSSWGCGNSNGGIHYHIDFDGDDFKEYFNNKSTKTVRYSITVNKEENEKLTTTAPTNIKLTIKDTGDYVARLTAGNIKKYYYSIEADKNSQDLAVTYIKNFVRTGEESTIKEAEVSMNYLDSSNGFAMKAVPAKHIVKKVKKQTTGAAGTLYYEVTAPKNAKNWGYEVEDGKIRLSWNKADGRKTLSYATTGTYKVTLYSKSTSSDKLKEIGSYSFQITNSQAVPKLAVYESIQGNKTSIPIDKSSALPIVKANLKFSYDGNLIDWANPDYTIKLRSATLNAYKLKVNKVDITVPIDDGDSSTNYTYTTTLTVNKSIYYFEAEEN